MTGALEHTLRENRERGVKALVPYVTGGYDAEWPRVVEAVAAAGANAIEIGIAFSDPVMDGPVIQEASVRALRAGATPLGVLSELRQIDVGVPLVVMTYVNLVAHLGYRRFADELAAAGVAGAILPDLPVDEAGPWLDAAAAAGVDSVLLAAPTTPEGRLVEICRASRGFLYAVGLLGVTGERETLAATATTVARRAKAVTDLPVLVGVGVSTPDQAREVAAVADGVIVGSALVRRLLDGAGPLGAGDFVGSLREGLNEL